MKGYKICNLANSLYGSTLTTVAPLLINKGIESKSFGNWSSIIPKSKSCGRPAKDSCRTDPKRDQQFKKKLIFFYLLISFKYNI